MAPEPSSDPHLMFTFAHDVRTHLRTVITRIQLVQRSSGDQLPEEGQALLHEALTAAGDIQGLLTAMMAYCEAGLKEAGSQAVMRLPLLLRGAVLEHRSAVNDVGGQLEVSNDLDHEVPADLQKILKELITNACKFRRAETPLLIRIATRHVDGSVEIAVTDNGMSVSPAYLDKMFVPFQRLNGREFEGYGLGLATCRRLSQAWGGSIGAEIDSRGYLTIRVIVPV
jgi:signal transduction histidine kinase